MPDISSPDVLLEVDDLAVNFGGVRAVDGVSFTVGAGQFVGIIGPNGCGKTTLLNAITGVVPSTGAVRLGGSAIPRSSPGAAYAAGVSRVFQAPQIFAGLSVVENVVVGCRSNRAGGIVAAVVGRPRMWRNERPRWARAVACLERVGLASRTHDPIGDLSYGQLRLVELARGLAADPLVLLLDEPSAGLNDAETDGLADLLAELHGDGLTLVMVDHKIDVVDRLCQRVVVLETGRRIAEGAPAEVWADARVMDAYLGVVDDA
jgi:branched-chain amino acid transport system ATP-binding protein